MKILLIFIFVFLALVGSETDTAVPCREQVVNMTDKVLAQQIEDIWLKLSPVLSQWADGRGYVSDGFKRAHPAELYDIQIQTTNLLRYSTLHNDTFVFESLLKLYNHVFQSLEETNQYTFFYYPGSPRQSVHTLNKPYKLWRNSQGIEIILNSSQFLYVVSEALVFIANTSPSLRSAAMIDFAASSVNILKNHYLRWCFSKVGPFQVRGWGCRVNGKYVSGGLNHRDFLTKKLHAELGDSSSQSYCNAVTDTDLWIITGLANLLSADYLDSNLVKLSGNERELYQGYLADGLKLVKQRLTFVTLRDFSKNKVEGVLFDSGAWNDSRDYRYSQYTGYLFPEEYNMSSNTETSWDISHSRRYVDVFVSLVRNAKIMGLDFPTEHLLKSFSNQFVYKVFNANYHYPLFSNYWNGDNGWYRVGYAKRQGFGYAPNDLSISSLTGGYAWLAPYNKDLKILYARLYEMVKCPSYCENQWLLNYFSGNRYKKYQRFKLQVFEKRATTTDDFLMLDFLPTLYGLKRSLVY